MSECTILTRTTSLPNDLSKRNSRVLPSHKEIQQPVRLAQTNLTGAHGKRVQLVHLKSGKATCRNNTTHIDSPIIRLKACEIFWKRILFFELLWLGQIACDRRDNNSGSILFAQAVQTAQHLYTEGLQAGSTATCSLDSIKSRVWLLPAILPGSCKIQKIQAPIRVKIWSRS